MKRFGDDEWAVIAEIARMYYVEGRSQQEIANQLFFSKAKVSRALRLAREENVVEFHINYPSSRSAVLETELKRRFGLKETLVVTDLYDNLNTDISIKRIGKVAASYLDELLKDGDTIGVSWGRTIYQTVRQLEVSAPRKIQVVQLVGNSTNTYNMDMDVSTMVQEMAQAFQGTTAKLYAPMHVNSDIVRKELLKEPIIQETMEKIRCTDYVLTGIADVSVEWPINTWAGYLSESQMKELIKKGAVGYICGYFLDKNGNKLHDPINDKIVGISFEDLKNAPHVIVVAGGVDKTRAIYAALKGRIIDSLITDSRIAEKLLALDDMREKCRKGAGYDR